MNKSIPFPFEWITRAEERISPHINVTPLTLDKELGIYLKWENHQMTGSFKARGAFNKVLSLDSWEQQKGIVAASAGNHGQGVALAGKFVGAPVTVFASQHASPLKIEKMRVLGADVRLVPGQYEQAEQEAKRYSAANSNTWISPYNDPQVIAGQGTIGLEIDRQMELSSAMTVLVPVSGGGLLAGIAASLTEQKNHPKVIGVQAEASAFMHALFNSGSPDGVPDLPTLADGLSGPVENGSITVPLIRAMVDDLLLVTEEDILYAMAYAYYHYGETIEASAAVGLSAILTGKVKPPAIVVISGGNILPELHTQVCTRYEGGL